MNSRVVWRAALFLAVAIALAVFTLGPLGRAQWAVQDDHEIAFFAGPTGRLSVSQIPDALGQTEVGQAGRAARFRPSYWVMRLAEISAWGFSPPGWYRTRLFLYILSIFIAGWLLVPYIGPLATIGLLVWALSPPYWFHVWGRLGTPESYAAFGLALWVLGVHLLWSSAGTPSRYRRVFGVLAFIVGNGIVAGAKETLLIIAVPNAFLALLEVRRGRTGGLRWWVCLGNVAVAAAVAAPLAVYFAARPVDYYGRSVGVEQRFGVLLRGTTQATFVHLTFLVTLLLWLGSRLLARVRLVPLGPAWRRLTWGLVLSAGSAMAIFVSQYVLYNGDITPGTHYEFPASLAGPGLLVALSVCLRDFFVRVGAASAERAVYYATATVMVCAALLSLPGLGHQREISRGWAAATRDFTGRMTAAAMAARADVAAPIVVVSGRPLDQEAIFAVDRFLRALGTTNMTFVLLDWGSRRAEWTTLEAYLAPDVERLAREGGVGIAPASSFDPTAPCFSIGLSHEPRAGCQSLGRLW